MPKKPNYAGNQQNYVPAGNGDASGEYADNPTGSNIHYTNYLKEEVQGEVKTKGKSAQQKLEENLSIDDIISQINKDKKKDKVFEDDEDIDFTPPFLDDDDFEDLDIDIDDVKTETIDLSNDDVYSYSDEECYQVLFNVYEGEFDEQKVKKLNSEKLHDLVIAKKQVEDAKNQNIDVDFNQDVKDIINQAGLSGVWSPSKVFEGPQETLNSINAKIEFFKDSGNLQVVNKLEQLKVDVKSTLGEWEDNIAYKNKAYSDLENSKKLLQKYENADNPYSQKRKDKAVWYKTTASSSKFFTPYAQKQIDMLKSENPKGFEYLQDYTGSYSSINNPLRGIDYSWYDSTKKAQFIDRVSKMTEALDKCTYDFDCWVQRGVNELNIGPQKLSQLKDDKNALDSLVGTTFEDQGFMSCGTSKGSGFAGKEIIMNIYCPKGTKMIYAKPFSHYSSEDETIIQRGYSYKIAKVEKTNGKVYIDCEVILGSDEKKHDIATLESLKEKHIKG